MMKVAQSVGDIDQHVQNDVKATGSFLFGFAFELGRLNVRTE